MDPTHTEALTEEDKIKVLRAALVACRPFLDAGDIDLKTLRQVTNALEICQPKESERPVREDRSCDNCKHGYNNHNHTKNAYDFYNSQCRHCTCMKYVDKWIETKTIYLIQD